MVKTVETVAYEVGVCTDTGDACCYAITPHLALEYFGDEVLILLVHRNKLVTATRSLGAILELMQDRFGLRPFSRKEVAGLFAEHFGLTTSEAFKESRDLLHSWLDADILTIPREYVKSSGKPCYMTSTEV